MDEFSLSSHYNNYYGCTEKGKKDYISLIYYCFSIFFVIYFFCQKLYTIKWSNKSMNSEFIRDFVDYAML